MLILLLLLGGVLSLQDMIHNQGTLHHQDQFDDQILNLQQGKLSRFIMAIQTTSMVLEQPLLNLDEAVRDMVSDLQDDMDSVQQDYLEREGQHKRIIDQLTISVGDAQIEISESFNLVNNVYLQERDQLSKKLDLLQDNIRQNTQSITREQLSRKEDKQLNQNRLDDHKNCFASIDLILDAIQTMINGDLGFEDMPARKDRIERISMSFDRSSNNYPMLTALLEAFSNVDNLKSLRKIRGKLNKLRNSIQNQFNQDVFHERYANAMFEKRMAQLEKEQALFKAQLNEALSTFTNVKLKIEQETNFQETRTMDVETYQEQMVLENESFGQETQIYMDLKNQYFNELDKAQKAIGVIKSNQYADLVRQKIDLRFSKLKP